MTKFFILLFVFMAGCQPLIDNRNSTGTTVVCFGDSLTAGFGAADGHDYPSYLRDKITLPVINSGVSNNTTRDALKRLDKDVLTFNPKLVIITLGVNDFFQSIPRKETLDNMVKMIERIKKRGAMVVWAEVRVGVLGDPYIEDFTALANREHILLLPDILSGIIDNPQLKYDQIHPNDEGYQVMAGCIYQKIKGLI